jgi:hypothetical protein
VWHAIWWIDLKHQFQFEQYQYCKKCGLPQGDFTPLTYPIFKPGTNIDCPFDDFAAVLIWHIIHTDDIWKQACTAFSGLKANIPLNLLI